MLPRKIFEIKGPKLVKMHLPRFHLGETRYKYVALLKNCEKHNARAKFTFQNLMLGQKLTPKIPNALARTSVSTFIREYLPPLVCAATLEESNY